MTASMSPVARPFSTGRVGAGTDAAGEAVLVNPSPARITCVVCGSQAEPGDDLCVDHGGMPDGIERHRLMREAC